MKFARKEANMAHEKYIKKNGKVYGPYSYESKRENGKVVTKYLGKETKKKNSFFKGFGVFVLFVFLLCCLFFLIDYNLTGKVLFDLNPVYLEGETLAGSFNLNLQQGELIPADAIVLVSMNGSEKAFRLDELVDENISSGDFYATNFDLNGNGDGYGLFGSRKIYPNVSFTLGVFAQGSEIEINDSEENASGLNESIVSGGAGGDSEDSGEDDVIAETDNETIEEINESSGEEINESSGEEINESISEDSSSDSSDEGSNESLDDSGSEEDSSDSVSDLDSGDEDSSSSDDNLGDSSDSSDESSSSEDSTETVSESDGSGDTSDSTASESSSDDSTESDSGESSSESSSDSADTSSESSSSDSESSDSGASITGEVVSEDYFEVFGQVNANSKWDYNLEDGQDAMIIDSEQKVNLVKNKNKLEVTTDYFEEENCFGEECVGNEDYVLNINLSKMNVTAQEGELILKLVYNDEIIVTSEEDIQVVEKNGSLELNLVNASVIEEVQYGAVLGKPVKWKKRVKVNSEEDKKDILDGKKKVKVDIPEGASNVSVKKVENKRGVAEVKDVEKSKLSITGNVVSDLEVENKPKWVEFLAKIFKSITGRVVENTERGIRNQSLIIEENASEFEIEYETPAPVAFEENTSRGKIINISSEYHYKNILAFTTLENETDARYVQLYHVVNGSRKRVSIDKYDTNENGLVDYIEWVVPHLSTQTYELVIEISSAEHLDSEKNFIADVYDEVSVKDLNGTLINDREYLRVRFEENLTSDKDITFYGNASCNESVLINEIEVPCEIYYKKLRLDKLRRENV